MADFRRIPAQPSLVPRTRSSRTLRGESLCELRVQKRHQNHRVAGVLFDSEVRSEIAANACELRNRDTSLRPTLCISNGAPSIEVVADHVDELALDLIVE